MRRSRSTLFSATSNLEDTERLDSQTYGCDHVLSNGKVHELQHIQCSVEASVPIQDSVV